MLERADEYSAAVSANQHICDDDLADVSVVHDDCKWLVARSISSDCDATANSGTSVDDRQRRYAHIADSDRHARSVFIG